MLRTATTFKVPWLLAGPKFRKPKMALFSRDFQWLRTDDEVRRFASPGGCRASQQGLGDPSVELDATLSFHDF
jgi:hypothetical protein